MSECDVVRFVTGFLTDKMIQPSEGVAGFVKNLVLWISIGNTYFLGMMKLKFFGG